MSNKVKISIDKDLFDKMVITGLRRDKFEILSVTSSTVKVAADGVGLGELEAHAAGFYDITEAPHIQGEAERLLADVDAGFEELYS